MILDEITSQIGPLLRSADGDSNFDIDKMDDDDDGGGGDGEAVLRPQNDVFKVLLGQQEKTADVLFAELNILLEAGKTKEVERDAPEAQLLLRPKKCKAIRLARICPQM